LPASNEKKYLSFLDFLSSNLPAMAMFLQLKAGLNQREYCLYSAAGLRATGIG
jgi:hypothetical protein